MNPSNPYGLSVVWGQGDLVARTTLVLLALMSLLSWYVMLAKLLEQRKQERQAQDARAAFAGAKDGADAERIRPGHAEGRTARGSRLSSVADERSARGLWRASATSRLMRRASFSSVRARAR